MNIAQRTIREQEDAAAWEQTRRNFLRGIIALVLVSTHAAVFYGATAVERDRRERVDKLHSVLTCPAPAKTWRQCIDSCAIDDRNRHIIENLSKHPF